MFYHHHLASVAAHHHQLQQNRIHNVVTTPSPPTVPPQQSTCNFSAPTTSITSSTNCTFMTTNTTGTITTACQQRTIAKPIARRPANAANHLANGANGNLHNSTLLVLAAAAANSVSNGSVASTSGRGPSSENTINGGEEDGSASDSPALQGNAAISSSSAPGNYLITFS